MVARRPCANTTRCTQQKQVAKATRQPTNCHFEKLHILQSKFTPLLEFQYFGGQANCPEISASFGCSPTFTQDNDLFYSIKIQFGSNLELEMELMH